MMPGLCILDHSAISFNYQLNYPEKYPKTRTSINCLSMLADSQINGKWRPHPTILNREKT